MCSNDFTATIIQAPASDWPFANVLSNAITVESGSNPSPDKAHSSTSRSPADKEQPRRPLILVVDDNKADVFLIREALAAAHVDADLHVVHDGHAALRFLDAADRDRNAPSPDLVLLDLNLPKVNGEKVLKHLRGSAQCGDTLVVIVTSSDSTHERETMTGLGISGYFRKPSEYSEFLQLGLLVKKLLLPSSGSQQ